MAAVLLPPTFHNSFWSNQDYFRTGLEVLMRKLQEGCDENVEIGVFIKAQAQHYRQLSRSIVNDTPSLPLISESPTHDSPSTLKTTLTTLHSSAITAQADHYARLADDLEFRVAREFERWSAAHRNRVIMASEEALGSEPATRGNKSGDRGLVGRYEALGLQVAKLKQAYLSKARLAEDLEEDARFAPHYNLQPPSTPQKPNAVSKNLTPALPSSPRLASIRERANNQNVPSSDSPTGTGNTNLRRTGTVAERINEKLRAAANLRRTPGVGSGGSISSLKGIGESMISMSLADSKAIDTPTSGLPPLAQNSGPGANTGDYILLAGLSMPITKLFELLAQLQHYLATSLPSDDADSGEDSLQRDEVKKGTKSGSNVTSNEDGKEEKNVLLAAGMSGVDINREDDDTPRSRTRMTVLGSYDCCVSGSELREWLLRHVEGFGSDPARGSEAGAALVKWGLIGRIGVGRGWQDDSETFYYLKDAAFDTSPFAIESLKNHIRASEPASKASAAATNTTSPAISTPTLPSLSTASTLVKSYLPALTSLPSALASASDTGTEAPHVKARKEAKIADEEYRAGVDELETMRLGCEEWVEKGLKTWERWERERMGSVKTVLGQYQSVITTLPGRMQAWTADVKIAVEAFKPDVDFRAMIDNNRIGNFRPTPHVYESLDSDEPDVSFGIDLRKWAGSNWKAILRDSENEKPNGTGKGSVPPAFMALLKGLEIKYAEIPDDLRRKSWIYLVDLRETHELRERLNDPHVPLADMLDEVTKFNAPVIAATVKLWFLELNQPVCGYDAYEACKSIYAKRNDNHPAGHIASAISEIMGRLSGVQILILHTLFAHLQELIRSTKTEEEDDVFITKLSLSLGRAILRPPMESAVTLQDRTPSRLFTDLYHHRQEIFSPLVERAQKAIDRPMPVRKRTRPVDQRISRTRLSESGEDGVQLYRNLQATPASSMAAAGDASEPTTLQEEEARTPRRESYNLQQPVEEQRDAEATKSGDEHRSPTDDVLGDYTDPQPEDEHTPTADRAHFASSIGRDQAIETESSTGVPDNEAERPTTPPARIRRSLDEDVPVTPIAGSPAGARLSRARPMSVLRKEMEDGGVLSEGSESSLKRAGSGDARAVRGPRGARGPRPGPNKLGSVDLSGSPNTAGRPGSPSIKDRIANLESRAGGGNDSKTHGRFATRALSLGDDESHDFRLDHRGLRIGTPFIPIYRPLVQLVARHIDFTTSAERPRAQMSHPHPHSGYGTYNDHDPRPQAPLHLHTLPKRHGPASSSTRISSVYSLSSLEHAPTFVKSVGKYDELGRSSEDGVAAGVIDGKGKGKEVGHDGEALAFWKGLELGRGDGGPRKIASGGSVTPQHVGEGTLTSSIPASATTKPNPIVPPTTTHPLVIPRDQWFIRRALLAKEQRERETRSVENEPSVSTTDVSPPTNTPPTTRPATPSLANLLSDSLPPPPTVSAGGPEVVGYQPPAYFHLKPDNKGWQVLKKYGWDEHGGLGRGSAEPGVGTVRDSEIGEMVKREDGSPPAATTIIHERESSSRKGKTEDSAIDLTLDSGTESDSDSTIAQNNTNEKFGQEFIDTDQANARSQTTANPVSGAGRTAPVATYLKTDLRGIGALSASERRRTLLRPTTLAAADASNSAGKRKRVTHTQEEIRAVARDVKASGDGLVGESRIVYDKKKAKKDAKVDRQERQRWRDIINM